MPFKAPENPKCPKCGKSVYHAEARVVGDVSFHKECYKCSMCNKMLDSTNSNMHENVLYCKTCHGRKFGPKGYGFGGGAAGLSMDTGSHLDRRREEVKAYKPPKAAPGEGCPRCGGKVFAAEEMLAKGKSYHRSCFNCKACRKPLDSVVHCDGPDNNVYCKVCYGKAFGPKGYGFGAGAGTLTCGEETDAPIVRPHGNPDAILPTPEGEIPCPRCGGRVFTAELMLAKGRPYHKKCFKCKVCKRPLDSMVHCDGPDNEVYCKLCYAKKYGPKGYGFAAGGGGVLVAENIPGGEDMPGVNPASATLDVTKIKAEDGKGCPRCGGKVFMAEEINVRQRSFHKRCYNCCFCHRPLDSVTGCDSPDGEVYCKLCYAKKYGPKGYGFAAGGGGVLVAENIGGSIDDTSKMEAKKADTGRLDTAKIQAEKGKGCPRCGGKVFMAEEMHARGRSYHKRCYNCCHCHRPLDSMVGCDAPDGEIYCKLCYAKKYGPKGYGFAAGCGGVLVAENIPGGRDDVGSESKALMGAIDTTSIPAAPGEGCPRCGGKVFTAEEKLSRNKKWHKRCYSCRECFRPLDSMVLCDGPDGDIYCKLCYAKKYGPKGYGFAAGAGGVLVPENFAGEDDFDYLGLESDDGVPKQRPAKAAFTVLDVTKFPAKEGQSRCPRCGGAVFQAEAMPCRGKEWHKRCYNCCECHRPLDSMLSCDAPDGEIYCKLCYAKRHGPKGYGYGHMPALVSLGTEDGCPMPTDIRQFGFGGKGPQPQVPRQAPPPGPPHIRTPGGMPTPLVGSYPPQQVHSIISPPKPMPIDQGIPVPRGFESSATHWGMGPIQAHGGSSQTVTVLQSAASSSSQSSSHQGQVTRIITGVHMDGGSPVPIVAGVSSGPHPSVLHQEIHDASDM
ncbi:muscle LIM protein Mlp84B-like isoform X3 [Macrobrachium nipponense]|uniref:muscle LIM protein Mlp84B-like isoform X3 n=1 Tax=Macrobrachium nipponense TaxID=159736 RepID=UPI0030C809F4